MVVTVFVRILSIFLLGGLLLPSAAASAAVPLDTTTADHKYWIAFDERPAPSASPEATPPVARSYLEQLRAEGVQPIVRSRWLHAVSAVLTPDERTAVRALPFVQHVRLVGEGTPDTHTDARPSPTSTPRFPPSQHLQFGASRTHLSRINAVAPMEGGFDGRGVRVGFLDAHFRGFRHAAFSALRHEDRLIALRSFPEGTQGGKHGAAVAAVTLGRDPGNLIGPAHGAQALAATTEYTPSERNVEEDYFVAGLEWLARHGADVVNVSIGYTTFDEGEDDYTPDDLDGDTGITTRAVDQAAQRGITVVVSAGNSGCASPDNCWYYVNTPADADSAITVGAVTPDSTLADFSSRGPTADGRILPDVVVQGTNVIAPWNNGEYAQLGGTSFASPQVTGVVAQMLQINPALSPIELRTILRRTASQSQNPDNRMGWGIVDAAAALHAAERRARANPPSSLLVEAPYPTPAATRLTIPVRVPARTPSLHLTLESPLGRTVAQTTTAVRPGPNWITLDLQSVPSGLYRYRLDGPHTHHTGTIAVDRAAAAQ